jgi:hypothetical protein
MTTTSQLSTHPTAGKRKETGRREVGGVRRMFQISKTGGLMETACETYKEEKAVKWGGKCS